MNNYHKEIALHTIFIVACTTTIVLEAVFRVLKNISSRNFRQKSSLLFLEQLKFLVLWVTLIFAEDRTSAEDFSFFQYIVVEMLVVGSESYERIKNLQNYTLQKLKIYVLAALIFFPLVPNS